jgi:hypothetical protein
MTTNRCFTLFAFLPLLSVSAIAAINPQVAFTVSIPNAGPMAFDGTYLWVASSDLVSAIDPATGVVVASQSILGTQFIAYDAPTGTLWLEGGSQSAQLNKVNAQQIIANNGMAPVNSIAFSFGLPTGLALDSSASGRHVWAVAGGVVTIIQMETLMVINTISAPDGYPITQIDAAPGLDGMMVSTSGFVGTQPVANVWFFGPKGASIWKSPYHQRDLSPGAWDTSQKTQFWGEAGDGAVYKYIFARIDGKDTMVRYTLHLTDATDNQALHLGGISGLAVYAPGGLALVARQEVDVPNQVYFVSLRYGSGAHEVPGVTVAGAALTAFGGGLAWASAPGSAGSVTAMTY